jgi:hypothetical protein
VLAGAALRFNAVAPGVNASVSISGGIGAIVSGSFWAEGVDFSNTRIGVLVATRDTPTLLGPDQALRTVYVSDSLFGNDGFGTLGPYPGGAVVVLGTRAQSSSDPAPLWIRHPTFGNNQPNVFADSPPAAACTAAPAFGGACGAADLLLTDPVQP